MSLKKINLSNKGEVRERILSGLTKMLDLVGNTLGPAGLSVMIDRGTGEPLLVDDGRRVAENMKLDDPIEQMAVRVCYGVTRKTDEKVGDGTTTSMVLSHAILDNVFKEYLMSGIGSHANVNDIDAQIQKSKDEVIKMLEANTKQIKTQKELADVSSIVAGDSEIGKTIADMYWKLGKDGHISMEFNLLSEKIETEIVAGYRFSGGYAANWMINNALRKNWVAPDVDILITKKKILDVKEIEPIANIVGNRGKSYFVIIAHGFGENVLKFAYQNGTRKNSPFLLMCIKAPGRVEEAFKDMAVFTGGKYFSESDDLRTATKEDLGHVGSIEVTDDTTILIDGAGKKADVDKRIKEVEAEAILQKMPQFKQDRYERASALSSGVGVIRIGAPTNEERNWLKYKIEDAKHATKQAYKYGVVRGGGLAFKEISEKLPDSNILKKALMAPYQKLKDNAGGTFIVGKNITDPVSVEKAALEYACSAVSKLIRIGGAIAFTKPSLVEELGALINNKNASSEQDYGVQEDNDF